MDGPGGGEGEGVVDERLTDGKEEMKNREQGWKEGSLFDGGGRIKIMPVGVTRWRAASK